MLGGGGACAVLVRLLEIYCYRDMLNFQMENECIERTNVCLNPKTHLMNL